MAFWAINAFDKVKNFSSQATKKIKGYVHVAHETPEFKLKPSMEQPQKSQKKVLTENQLMQLQLKEYKKLVLLQQKVLKEYEERERSKCEARQKQLQELNQQLIQKEEEERKTREKQILMDAIESGKSNFFSLSSESIQDVIEENIHFKEKLILSGKS